jgi:molybdate transport system permease protein
MIRATVAVCAIVLLAFIAVPLVGLAWHLGPREIAAIYAPTTLTAFRLSFFTTTIALAITVLLGTPLAYVLARSDFRGRTILDTIIDLPIVVPPAVAGLALLLVFGRNGTFGPALRVLGLQLSFSTAAVVMAQVFVASPFYVRSARSGLMAVDRQLEAASQTLGMGPLRTFALVTVPLAAPSLIGGALLCWARALGEFGATIMFAGNLAGVSQTLPLAVYLNLENGDVPVATAISVALIVVSIAVVSLVRLAEGRR